MDEMDLEDMWFQQDGATCHTSLESMALLHETFLGRVISRLGERNWPPGSLNALDFFLCFFKSKVYLNKTHDHPSLEGGYYPLYLCNPATVMPNRD